MSNFSNSYERYEPMDIDLSVHSNNAMDISSTSEEIDVFWEADSPRLTRPLTPRRLPEFPELIDETTAPLAPPSTNTYQSSNIKKFHINIINKETFCPNATEIKIVCTIVILSISILAYYILNIQCGNNINPDELNMSFNAKLYGQSQAKDSLIEALSVDERHKILFLYGGTGVGKTYSATLILEHVGNYANVYHYTMPSFMVTFTTDFMVGLSVCKHTTFIIDDLSAEDMNVKSVIKELITKSEDLDKNITVILIYNCDNVAKDFEEQCDGSFPNKLIQNFNDIDAFKKLIKFEPLKEEHLKKCIETELGNTKLENDELENIMKDFNVSRDGCKGVYTKMKLLEKS